VVGKPQGTATYSPSRWLSETATFVVAKAKCSVGLISSRRGARRPCELLNFTKSRSRLFYVVATSYAVSLGRWMFRRGVDHEDKACPNDFWGSVPWVI
jgi:hypothetical protein